MEKLKFKIKLKKLPKDLTFPKIGLKFTYHNITYQILSKNIKKGIYRGLDTTNQLQFTGNLEDAIRHLQNGTYVIIQD